MWDIWEQAKATVWKAWSGGVDESNGKECANLHWMWILQEVFMHCFVPVWMMKAKLLWRRQYSRTIGERGNRNVDKMKDNGMRWTPGVVNQNNEVINKRSQTEAAIWTKRTVMVCDQCDNVKASLEHSGNKVNRCGGANTGVKLHQHICVTWQTTDHGVNRFRSSG